MQKAKITYKQGKKDFQNNRQREKQTMTTQ
jgi:hypothetical protein